MITVVDYQAGNLRSVERALAYLGLEHKVAQTAEEILGAERLIFPGVGHAKSAMEYLNASGFADALRQFVAKARPFLGICLGSQIILEYSTEGNTPCLGLLEGRAVFFTSEVNNDAAAAGLGHFEKDGIRHKVPHMGWNRAQPNIENKIAQAFFKGIPEDSSYYFVHSYYTKAEARTEVLANTDYGFQFASGLGRDNIASFQFHPEKSGKPGLKILENFANWRP